MGITIDMQLANVRYAFLGPAEHVGDLWFGEAALHHAEASLKYGRTKRMDEVSYGELSYLGSRARLPETAVISAARETVEAFMAIWSAEKGHLPLAKQMAEALDAHLPTHPLLRS